jgi:hypothetical protein
MGSSTQGQGQVFGMLLTALSSIKRGEIPEHVSNYFRIKKGSASWNSFFKPVEQFRVS